MIGYMYGSPDSPVMHAPEIFSAGHRILLLTLRFMHHSC